MFNFDNLNPEGKTAEYTYNLLNDPEKGPPVLTVRCADSCKPYKNSLLLEQKKSRMSRGRQEINLDDIESIRDLDRKYYPKYIITGWRNVYANDGEHAGDEVPFSEAACASLLEKVPDWIFDELRIFCCDPGMFTENAITHEDIKESAKK